MLHNAIGRGAGVSYVVPLMQKYNSALTRGLLPYSWGQTLLRYWWILVHIKRVQKQDLDCFALQKEPHGK